MPCSSLLGRLSKRCNIKGGQGTLWWRGCSIIHSYSLPEVWTVAFVCLQEHSIANMFLISLGINMGANVSIMHQAYPCLDLSPRCHDDHSATHPHERHSMNPDHNRLIGLAITIYIRWLYGIFTEGVIWGQKWYGFCMLLGYGSLNWQVQAQLWYADSNAAELETCQLGEPYLIGCGMNPTFWAAICCIWPARA